MPTRTDSFGIWNDLGTAVPVIDKWIKFPITATGGLDTIRATFIYPQDAELNSFAWIRQVYSTENSELVTQAMRIYPKLEPLLLQMAIPSDLRFRDIYFRSFEVKKNIYGRRFIVPDYRWRLKLEELLG